MSTNPTNTISSVRSEASRNSVGVLRYLLATLIVLHHLNGLMGLQIPLLLHAGTVVYAFFALSGFFAWQSYERSASSRIFIRHRLFRLLPVYWAVVLVSAIGLALVSDLSVSAYFSSSAFWKYLCANGALLNFLAPELPGVFTDHLLTAVNGSLWYVKLEVAFTFAVPLIDRIRKAFQRWTARMGTASWGNFWKCEFLWNGFTVWFVLSLVLFAVSSWFAWQGTLAFRYLCNFQMFLSGIICAQRGLGIWLRPAFWKISFFSLILLGIFVEYRASVPSEWLYFLFSAVVVWALIVWSMSTGAGAFFNRNNMTYSLYLCHFPLIQLALSLTSDSVSAMWLSALLLSIVTPLLYYGIERRKSFFCRS